MMLKKVYEIYQMPLFEKVAEQDVTGLNEREKQTFRETQERQHRLCILNVVYQDEGGG